MRFIQTSTFIVLTIVSLLAATGCNNQKAPAKSPTGNINTDTTTAAITGDTTAYHGYNELANSYEKTHFTISDYNTDNPEIDNIERPTKNTIDTKLDTSLLFNIWVQYEDWPHADFWWTGKSFFIVDYDGDGDMPFTLKDSLLTVYYNDFIQKGKIISVTTENLTIHWDDTPKPTTYMHFED